MGVVEAGEVAGRAEAEPEPARAVRSSSISPVKTQWRACCTQVPRLCFPTGRKRTTVIAIESVSPTAETANRRLASNKLAR